MPELNINDFTEGPAQLINVNEKMRIELNVFSLRSLLRSVYGTKYTFTFVAIIDNNDELYKIHQFIEFNFYILCSIRFYETNITEMMYVRHLLRYEKKYPTSDKNN